jgi:hypothetical protein
MSNAQDWTAKYPVSGTAAMAYAVDTTSSWANASSIVNGSTSTAQTGTTNPIDVYPGPEDNENSWVWWALNDIGVKIWGCGSAADPADRTVSVGLFKNPVSGTIGTPYHVVLPSCTAGLPAVPSSSSDTDGVWPNEFPAQGGLFGGWGSGAFIGADSRSRGGAPMGMEPAIHLNAVAGSLTIPNPGARNHFGDGLTAGNKIYIAGSAPTCANNLCTLSVDPASAVAATISENLSLADAAYQTLPWGVRIQKITATGTVKVGTAYKLAGSIVVNNASGATNLNCNVPIADNGKSYQICYATGSRAGMNLMYWIASDGTSGMLWQGAVPASGYFTGTLHWNANEVPASMNCFSAYCTAQPSNSNGRDWVIVGPNVGGTTSVWNWHYDGHFPALDWNYSMGYNGGTYVKTLPSDGATWSIISGYATPIASLITSAFPSYDSTLYGLGFAFYGISHNTAYFVNIYNGGVQDTPAWIAEFDIGTGSLVATNLIHTMDGTGTNGGIKYGGVHNVTVLPQVPDAMAISTHAMSLQGETAGTATISGTTATLTSGCFELATALNEKLVIAQTAQYTMSSVTGAAVGVGSAPGDGASRAWAIGSFTGQATVSGTALTATSGSWTGIGPGAFIVVGGVENIVDAVTDSTHLTLHTAPGNGTGIVWATLTTSGGQASVSGISVTTTSGCFDPAKISVGNIFVVGDGTFALNNITNARIFTIGSIANPHVTLNSAPGDGVGVMWALMAGWDATHPRTHYGPFLLPVEGLSRGGSFSSNTSMPWPIDNSYDSACPSGNPYESDGATGNNCFKVLVPASDPCNIGPGAGEWTKWHSNCHAPAAPITGWHSGNYAAPFALAVGDRFNFYPEYWDNEPARIVAIDKVSHGPGHWVLTVQRDADWTYACSNTHPPVHGANCLENDSQLQHASGWWIRMMPGIKKGTANPPFFVQGQTESGITVLDLPNEGHADVIAGPTPGTVTQVAVSQGMAAAAPASVFVPGNLGFVLPTPTFQGHSLPVGDRIQAYAIAVGGIRFFTDANAVGHGGGAPEGLDTTWARTLTPTATPNVYEITPVGVIDYKLGLWPIASGGKYNYKDVSSPTQPTSGPTAALSAPFTHCTALAAGECYAGSTAGKTYINAPRAWSHGGYCGNGQTWANIPCVIAGWFPGAGAFRQQGWTHADPQSATSRFLSYDFQVPGAHYGYSGFPVINANQAWLPWTMQNNWGAMTFIAKLPSYQESTNPANTIGSYPVTVAGGHAWARVAFGYSRFGNPAEHYCSPRAEGCSTGGSSWQFDHELHGLEASQSLWHSGDTPAVANTPSGNGPLTMGVKFTADVAGQITAIRFYKGTSNTGTHIGKIWNSSHTLLASVTFSGETASGWQQQSLSSPVRLTPGQTYVVSYYNPAGVISLTSGYFSNTATYDSGVLHARPNTNELGVNGNGVYDWGNTFPSQSSNSSNYFVDVVFQADPGMACSSGCTINVPVMPPNVLYASVMTSDDGTTWNAASPAAIPVSAADIGPCVDLAYSPTSKAASAAGGTGTVTLTVTDQSCTSVNTSSVAWLTITGASGGCSLSGGAAHCTGNGAFTWSAAANAGAPRSGSLLSDGGSGLFTLSEDGTCSFSIVPSSHNYAAPGESQAIVITASDPSCVWSAGTGAGWLTLDSTSGSGSTTIHATAAANSGSLRNANATIAGQTFSATQNAAVPPTTGTPRTTGHGMSGGGLR